MKKIVLLLLLGAGLPVLASAQIMFRGEKWYPKPLPVLEPAKRKLPPKASQPIRYELPTRQETIPADKTDAPPFFNLLPGRGSNFSTAASGPEKAVGTTAEKAGMLEPVPDPTGLPARMNVKLFVKKGSASWVCSGSLIDSRHVITAGHCLFDGGWADSVFVVPAYAVDTKGHAVQPYGVAVGLELLSWTGWTVGHDFEWDMGIVFLDRPVGALTSWYNYGASEDKDFYANNTFHNFSYPAEAPYNGSTMYYRQVPAMSYHYASVLVLDPDPHWWDSLYVYHCDYSYGGQSGSSYYNLDPLYGRLIYAVLSHGGTQAGPDCPEYTGVAYIHNAQFDQISAYIDGNIAPSTDLIALSAQVGNNTVVAGNMLDNFTFRVHNYSHQPFNGALDAKVYVSNDSLLTAQDLQISTISSSPSLPELAISKIYLPGDQPVVPDTIAPGDYWLGVTLDIADANVDNNTTGIWDVAKIHVLNVLVDPVQLQAKAAGDSLAFHIRANTYWFISNDAPWLGISQFDGVTDTTVLVTCAPNPDPTPREYDLLVVGPNGLLRKVHIWQAGVSLDVMPPGLEAPVCGGDVSFQVFSNFPWALQTDSIPAWIHIVPHGTQSGEQIILECAPNSAAAPRQAVIPVVAGQVVKMVNVSQPGDALSTPVSTVQLPVGGGQASVTISANTDWTLSNNSSWLTVGPMAGNSQQILQIDAPLNCGAAREAEINVTSCTGASIVIRVMQPGAFMQIAPSTTAFGASGGTVTAAVTTNLNWQVQPDAPWLSVSPSGGSGNGSIQLSAAPNPGLFERTAAVVVHTDCGMHGIAVSQAGQTAFLTAEPDTVQFSALPDTQFVVVTSNIYWWVSDTPAWLTVMPVNGIGGPDTVKIICQANPYLQARTGNVRLSTQLFHTDVHVFQHSIVQDTVGGQTASIPDDNTNFLLGGADNRQLHRPGAEEPALLTASETAQGVWLGVFPNPFSGALTIGFQLPAEQQVRLELWDQNGRRVAVLADEALGPGRHRVDWRPQGLSPGWYACRLTVGGKAWVKSVLYAR